MKKEPQKRGKVLFINALNEVTRKNAQSNLEDNHINKIASAYENYCDIDGFAKVATIKDIEKNNYSLSIPLYAREQQQESNIENASLMKSCTAWLNASNNVTDSYNTLKMMLNEEA